MSSKEKTSTVLHVVLTDGISLPLGSDIPHLEAVFELRDTGVRVKITDFDKDRWEVRDDIICRIKPYCICICKARILNDLMLEG